MFWFYSKEKNAKLVGSLAYSQKDVDKYLNGNHLAGYPNLNNENTAIVEYKLSNPTWTGTELREMTKLEICQILGDLSVLNAGEVYKNGTIIELERPQGLKIEWEYPEWVEKASQIEIDTQRVNKQYNEYMQLANTYDTELMKEEGVWENFRTFIDECRVYLTRIKKGVEVRSSIPMPSKNLEKFFENSFKEVDKNV